MREIKFRAWGKNSKEFLRYYEDSKDVFGLTLKNIQAIEQVDDWEFQQYTGLKDKNGVEIYEGDILGKRPYGYFKSDGTKDGRYKGREWDCFAVEWGEIDGSSLASGYEYELNGKQLGWNVVFGGYDDETKIYEVIGNIYENPDLLERGK